MDIREIIQAGGGPSKLAKKVGRTRASVGQWKRVPRDLIAKVSAITGIPREELAPDVFQDFDSGKN